MALISVILQVTDQDPAEIRLLTLELLLYLAN